MLSELQREVAAAAARWVVEEGLEYGPAKRRAVRDFGRRVEMPSNEAVEDAVREHLALFCADSQPQELRCLRRVALAWMLRLQDFQPYLAGAVWRGTATRLSCVQLELYCDDPKEAEIALINQGIAYESLDAGGAQAAPVLGLTQRCPELGEPVTLHLHLLERDDLRGALKPDAQGRSWRGDARALSQLLADEGAA